MTIGQLMVIPVLSGLATALGGIMAACTRRIGAGCVPVLLGLSSGIGFTVIFFDIMPEAVRLGSWAITISGFLAGVFLGGLTGLVFPHRSRGCNPLMPGKIPYLRRAGYMFAIGVAMHNLPEGLAMGAGLEARMELGILLAIAMGLHNLPEGMALAGIIILSGKKPAYAVALTGAAGMALPLGAFIAGQNVLSGPALFSFALAIGGGVLIYVIFSDIIPLSYSMNPFMARLGLSLGAVASLAYSISSGVS